MTITKERLLELAKNAGVAVFHKDLKKWTIPDRDSQIKLAQLIRNEVLEEVAVEFDGAQTQAGENISASIRAMKEQL